MKLLRNKKTGEVNKLLGTKMEMGIIWLNIQFQHREPKAYCYNSLAELNEEWEDYNEPLIEDPKIRKAVRAWMEANDLDGASFYTSSHFWYLRAFNHREQGIDFWLKWDDKPNLIENKYYTIEELCGEEEA